jgi:hypothetical protein
MLAAPCFKLGVVSEVDERVLAGSRDDVDRPAEAAVASVRPAARNELLAPETQTATPAVAGRDVDVHFVDEHQGSVYGSGVPAPGRVPDA